MALVVPNSVLLTQLQSMIADAVEDESPAGLLFGAKLRLYTNNITPDEDSVIGDFTQANFTGYAAETLVWNTPIVNDDGKPTTVAETAQFVCTTAPTETQPVYGYYVVTPSGSSLVFAERFSGGPTGIEAVNDAVVVVCKFSLSSIV